MRVLHFTPRFESHTHTHRVFCEKRKEWAQMRWLASDALLLVKLQMEMAHESTSEHRETDEERMGQGCDAMLRSFAMCARTHLVFY